MATGIPAENDVQKDKIVTFSDLIASSGLDLDVQILLVLCIILCQPKELPLTQVKIIRVFRVLPFDKPLSGVSGIYCRSFKSDASKALGRKSLNI